MKKEKKVAGQKKSKIESNKKLTECKKNYISDLTFPLLIDMLCFKECHAFYKEVLLVRRKKEINFLFFPMFHLTISKKWFLIYFWMQKDKQKEVVQ